MTRLRAGRPGAEIVRIRGKISIGLAGIRKLMAAGAWNEAILAAAKFGDLGDQAEAIQRGREAIQRPQFMRQLKRDPEAAIEAAKAAMLERWPL